MLGLSKALRDRCRRMGWIFQRVARNGHHRRSLWCWQDVFATGHQERPCHEKGGALQLSRIHARAIRHIRGMTILGANKQYGNWAYDPLWLWLLIDGYPWFYSTCCSLGRVNMLQLEVLNLSHEKTDWCRWPVLAGDSIVIANDSALTRIVIGDVSMLPWNIKGVIPWLC